MSNRHWQTEILMESFWWSFNEWLEAPAVPKKIHVWQTPIFLGMGLIKFSTYGSDEIKVEALFDSVQVEWCSDLAKYILLIISCLKQYNINTGRRYKKLEEKKTSSVPVTVNVTSSHINLFLSTENKENNGR